MNGRPDAKVDPEGPKNQSGKGEKWLSVFWPKDICVVRKPFGVVE